MEHNKIARLLEEKFKEPEFSDCFLVEVKNSGANKLEIFVDSDSSITFDKCRSISRHLESIIDEEQWMGEKYILDVSSPGIGRPLMFKRQYKKNIGRKIEVFQVEEKAMVGILTEVTDESITLEQNVRVKEGKKKVKKTIQTVIPFENITKTKVKITF